MKRRRAPASRRRWSSSGGANVFTTAVANLGPGEEVEVTVEYQQTVDFDGGEFHLRFPTVVAPRFDPRRRGAGRTGW